MTDRADGDYVLGTHDEEIERLGLQHRVWRPRMLEAFRNAGLTAGSHVIDVGAGPGFATVDLAEIVGAAGQVVAVERSPRYLAAMEAALARRGLSNVGTHQLDLMADPIPASGFDLAWCRWVACFVSDPQRLVRSVRDSLRVGGRAIFHEYGAYKTFRLAPRGPAVESFVDEVMASWRDNGGEPDVALALAGLLPANGFRITSAEPICFAARPSDCAWNWPASFISIHPQRLLELGRVDRAWCQRLEKEWKQAEADPSSIVMTPMVLELIAERVE